jgi:hypothetical protein
MKYILFILFISYFLYTRIYTSEHFTLVGSNSTYTYDSSPDTPMNIETNIIKKKLLNLTSDQDINISQDYSLYNNNLSFPFSYELHKLLSDSLVQQFTPQKLEIGKPVNIYWKDQSLDRIFIFNSHMRNLKNFTSYNLIVKFKIKNISNFFQTNSTQYSTNINSQNILNKSIILNVSLENSITRTYSFNGMDNLHPNYYEIQNHMNLMSPFYTSRNDMIITKEMQNEFDKPKSI